MKEFLVFGDIAGQYKAMMKIIKKAPDVIPVSVGDMIDRGPDSKEVLDFFRKTGHAIFGNHEHLFVDSYRNSGFYDPGIWMLNGGLATIESFAGGKDKLLELYPKVWEHAIRLVEMYYRGCYIPDIDLDMMYESIKHIILKHIPLEYIEWIENLEMYIEGDDYIITHAPIDPSVPFDLILELSRTNNIIWNRSTGTRRRKDGKFQIHGHNSHPRATELKDKQGVYGMNLDSSRGYQLTAMHYPSMKLYVEDYIN